MKRQKKILVLLFTIIFGVSNTGLPLVLHYCEVMESFSFTNCEICQANLEENDFSCCSPKTDELVIKKSLNDECCKITTLAKPIADVYNTQKIEYKIIYTKLLLDLSEHYSFLHQWRDASKHLFNDSSPPALTSNNIFLTNSVLLI